MIRSGRWQEADLTGMLNGKTFEVLSIIGPMSKSPFLTPFERGLLGNATGTATTRFTMPNKSLLEGLLGKYGVAEDKWKGLESNDERLKVLRPTLKALREAKLAGASPKGVDPAKSRLDVLDDPLFEKLQ
jgi:hypothetical protein